MSTMSPFVSENEETSRWSGEQSFAEVDLYEAAGGLDVESEVYPGHAFESEDWTPGHEDYDVGEASLAKPALGELETYPGEALGEAFPSEQETYWELEAEEEGSASERAIVERQIAAGMRDVNKLTNLVFWARHPELNGQRIPEGRRDLERVWVRIKNEIVVPALAAAPQAPASGSTAGAREFSLRYEGDPSKTRRVTKSDPEFQSDFVDNFVNAKAHVDKIEGKILKLEVEFRDGRKLVVDWQRIPVHYRGSVQTGFVDYFLKARDGFIYPIFDGKVAYSLPLTPNLVLARSDLEVRVRALRDLSELMILAGKFASIIKVGSKALGAVSGAISKSGATAVEVLQR
jgi:hypothetical protein